MSISTIFVEARWDGSANVWSAASTTIDGLAVEADTLEALKLKVENAVSDLIELNGIDSALSDIPICLLTSQISSVPNPKAA